MRVNICGIPYTVEEKRDHFDMDCHFGQVNYKMNIILINADMTDAQKKETLCHEMVHAILLHTGHNDLVDDERLVQALGNAICQGFEVKEYDKSTSD